MYKREKVVVNWVSPSHKQSHKDCVSILFWETEIQGEREGDPYADEFGMYVHQFVISMKSV